MEISTTPKKRSMLKELKPFEIVAYSISIVLFVWGLVECCLGIAQNFVSQTSNFYQAATQFKKLFGLSFLGWGLLLMAFGTIFGVIVLCIYAKTSDRAYEKEQRRAARKQKFSQNTEVIEQSPENK